MRKRYAANSTSPSKHAASMQSVHGHVAPPPAKKMKTEANIAAGPGPRAPTGSMHGVGASSAQCHTGALHGGLSDASPFACDVRSKLSSTSVPAVTVVQPRSAPNSHRRRSLQDRQVESIGWMSGRSSDDASVCDKDVLRRVDEATIKSADALSDDRRHFNLCDDRLTGETMTIDDTDLSHLSAEATLPLLDATRSFLHGADSPGASGSGIGAVGGGMATATPSACHSSKILLSSDMTLSASRVVAEAVRSGLAPLALALHLPVPIYLPCLSLLIAELVTHFLVLTLWSGGSSPCYQASRRSPTTSPAPTVGHLQPIFPFSRRARHQASAAPGLERLSRLPCRPKFERWDSFSCALLAVPGGGGGGLFSPSNFLNSPGDLPVERVRVCVCVAVWL